MQCDSRIHAFFDHSASVLDSNSVLVFIQSYKLANIFVAADCNFYFSTPGLSFYGDKLVILLLLLVKSLSK